jgi:hypothetical protein
MEDFTNFEVKKDLRQTIEYGEYIKKIGWDTLDIDGTLVFVRKLGPVSIAKIQRVDLPLPVDELREILKQRKVIMCKLEPLPGQSDEEMAKIKKLGFRQDKWPLLGSRTLRLDIRPSLEEIEKSFKKDARYCLKKSLESAIEIRSDDWNLFYELWKKAAKKKDLWILSREQIMALKECFADKAFCLTAGKMAGIVVIVTEGVAYYYFSAALPEAKQFQLPYRMIWEAIRKVKEKGAVIWDFEGIYDKRWPTHGWKGFTHFKKSFGGKEIEFPGSFVRWGLW